MVSRKHWVGTTLGGSPTGPRVWLAAGLGTYRSNTKKKKVLVSYVSFSCTEMEMTNSSQVAEEPGQRQRGGTGVRVLKLLRLTSRAGRGIRTVFKGVPLREGPARDLTPPFPDPQPPPVLLANLWLAGRGGLELSLQGGEGAAGNLKPQGAGLAGSPGQETLWGSWLAARCDRTHSLTWVIRAESWWSTLLGPRDITH